MKTEIYVCILSGDKWIMGFQRKCELPSTLQDTTGLVLTCKSCSDIFVNLNWKVVMPRYLTFSPISLSNALEHEELWPKAYHWGVRSHLRAKNHISLDTCHVSVTIFKLTQSLLACEMLKKLLRKVNFRHVPHHTLVSALLGRSAVHSVFHYWIS